MDRLVTGCELQLYIAASNNVVSVALIQEAPDFKLIYFVNRTLKGAEEQYSQIEKVALAVLTTTRRLQPYFQSHQVVMRTNQSVAKILKKLDLAGRMISWSVESVYASNLGDMSKANF